MIFSLIGQAKFCYPKAAGVMFHSKDLSNSCRVSENAAGIREDLEIRTDKQVASKELTFFVVKFFVQLLLKLDSKLLNTFFAAPRMFLVVRF